MEKNGLQDNEKESLLKEEKAKKNKKSKKKKKRHRISLTTGELVVCESNKKNSKKKKSNNGDRSVKVLQNLEVSQVEESLEGALVDGEMVLINRTSGKVYSGIERTENGEHEVIGTVSRSGSIILDKPGEGKDQPNIFLVRMYRSRLGRFWSFLLGQISCHSVSLVAVPKMGSVHC